YKEPEELRDGKRTHSTGRQAEIVREVGRDKSKGGAKRRHGPLHSPEWQHVQLFVQSGPVRAPASYRGAGSVLKKVQDQTHRSVWNRAEGVCGSSGRLAGKNIRNQKILRH